VEVGVARVDGERAVASGFIRGAIVGAKCGGRDERMKARRVGGDGERGGEIAVGGVVATFVDRDERAQGEGIDVTWILGQGLFDLRERGGEIRLLVADAGEEG